jgi:hypothetical protein
MADWNVGPTLRTFDIERKFLRRAAKAEQERRQKTYNSAMERKIFWIAFTVLGILADVVLPIWWALFATLPIGYASWWMAYRSGWFE